MATDVQNEVVNALRKHFKHEGSVTTPEVKVETGPAVKKKAPTVSVSGHMFSDIFGYVPAAGDFPVDRLPDNANEEIAMWVPEVDESYVVQKEEAATLVAGIMDGDKTLITGPTGSGKSSLVKYVCAKLNRPFIRINMSGDVESSHIFGTREVEGGATVWKDGALAEAVKHGAVVLVDEWELMPAEIAMGMQNLLEDGGYLYLKEKPGTTADRTYIPHKDFRMVFAGNTVGQGDISGAFNGVQVQNTATIDRFSNVIKLDYLTVDHEVAYLNKKTGVDASMAKKMVSLANLIRSAYNSGKLSLTMSPRTLINWGKKMERYTTSHAFKVSYSMKLTDDDSTSVKELYLKVFGKE